MSNNLAELHVDAGTRTVDLSLSRVVVGLVEGVVGATVCVVTRSTGSTVVEVELSRVVKGVRRDEGNVC